MAESFFGAFNATERAVKAAATVLWRDANPEQPVRDCEAWDSCVKQARDVLRAAADSHIMSYELGDEGWEVLASKAEEAEYDRRLVDQRRKRDDFTTAVIETAYQYGYREVLRRLGGKDWKNR